MKKKFKKIKNSKKLHKLFTSMPTVSCRTTNIHANNCRLELAKKTQLVNRQKVLKNLELNWYLYNIFRIILVIIPREEVKIG